MKKGVDFGSILNAKDYDKYAELSHQEQNDLFLKFKKPFDDLNKLSDSKIEELFPQYLEQAVILAVENNPVAQDFLTYIYKKGRTGIMQPNVLRAYEWGIVASNNYCMLSIDRLRFFFKPAYDTIVEYENLETLIEKYDLTEDNIEYFFASNIANMMISSYGDLSMETLSKADLIPYGFSDIKVRELEKVRDRVIENMLEMLMQ